MASKKMTVNTSSGNLNLRSGAGTSYGVVGSLAKGKTYTSTESKKVGSITWYKFKVGNVTGWASGKYLKVASSSSKSTNKNSSKESKKTKKTKTKAKTKTESMLAAMLNDSTTADELLNMTTRLYGSPHQFLSSVDYRVGGSTTKKSTSVSDVLKGVTTKTTKTDRVGRAYMEKIIAEAPIVYFTPGLPNYLPDVSEKKKNLLQQLLTGGSSDSGTSSNSNDKKIIDQIFGDTDARYFDFSPKYTEYFYYVNLLCRVSAVYMGLGNLVGPDKATKYKYYGWESYKWKADTQKTTTKTYGVPANTVGKRIASVMKAAVNAVGGVLETVADDTVEALFGQYDYVQFYCNSDLSFSESFSNSTTESKLASIFETGEDIMKEVSFLTGTGAVNGVVNSALSSVTGLLDSVAGLGTSGNFLDRLTSSATQVVQGCNMVFPEIWSRSTYDKSFSISIDLVSPYGTKEAIYLNIIVPLMHLLALTLPRTVTANSYASPFLVKAFAMGFFSCDLGIVDSLTINKGGEGYWSVNGLPTKVTVDIRIKELYSSLSMTKTTEPTQFFANKGLIEFLAVTCGVDITQPNVALQARTLVGLFQARWKDLPSSLYGEFLQAVRNFGSFMYVN